MVFVSPFQEQPYLVGDSLTLADICVYCRLLLMPYIGVKMSQSKYPGLCRWIAGLRTRKAFKVTAEHTNRVLKDVAR